MRLGKYLSGLTKPELEEFIENCNFSEEEGIIFTMLSKNKSIVEICEKEGISISTANRRIFGIKRKVEKINGKSC